MELRQLRNFLAVAEELHFGRAAKRLHISQPALSFDIRKLEERIGVQLFLRNSKEVRLTQCGDALLIKCRSLLESADELQQMLRSYAQGKKGFIRLGFINSMLHLGLPQAVQRFAAQYPGVDIALKEMGTHEQIQAIEQRQIDLGCANGAHLPASIQAQTMLEEDFVCCLPLEHPLHAQQCIALPSLQQQPFILFAPEVSPHFHHQILAQCAAAGFHPRILHQARTWKSIITMVGLGLGVALLPAGLQHIDTDRVCYRPVPDSRLKTQIMLLCRQEEQESCVQLLGKELLCSIRPATR
ncbi:LysR family transcriptional regulator [Aquitalea sp.]|uniref:LysR family transcriptional regulator n=1 Tax=Aquitalea sp. TaxID=1872623 RepID=UPI002584B557|nr:LysR family transcriptional regulator [Aquitalea sp.]